MSGETNEVIDLTDSFTLVDHCQLADAIIELDDTIYFFPPDSPVREKTKRNVSTRISNSKISQESSTSQTSGKKSSKGIGDCPVCWDELGKNPLASTKCGHVFCLQCIEKVVKQTKACPTCRCFLRGGAAYHPIYLSLN